MFDRVREKGKILGFKGNNKSVTKENIHTTSIRCQYHPDIIWFHYDINKIYLLTHYQHELFTTVMRNA